MRRIERFSGKTSTRFWLFSPTYPSKIGCWVPSGLREGLPINTFRSLVDMVGHAERIDRHR